MKRADFYQGAVTILEFKKLGGHSGAKEKVGG